MNEVKAIEDQPLPPSSASPETNARFQEQIDALFPALLRKFQLGGNQFNPVELELRFLVVNEQLNLLTEIVKGLTNGEVTDETITNAMTERVKMLTKNLIDALNSAPRLAIAGGALPPRMNGSKHN